ncbi:MAG: putative Ig domain-containing protein [Mycoplasmoidaceae bacterium]|nr:putative Ig domain-containing protein [Mycoplasmoidaceae bacterium]
MVEQSTTGLVGYSDKFSIIIQNISPSYLIINNNFTTINVNVGDTVTTPSLTDKITTNIGTKITTGITFSINGSLPTGLAFDTTTGVISGIIIDPTSSYDLSITASATLDSKTISGTSNGFSIVISQLPPKPYKLIIDYDFETILSAPGETISTPSLIGYIKTNTGDSVLKDDITFMMNSRLPDGLSFDSSVGKITGTLTENSESSYNLSIFVSAKVGSEQLYGSSNSFSIIVTHSPPEPTKLLINENIPTIYVKPNQAVRTSSLNESVATDTSTPITDGLTFSCDNLPSGFSINESTGVISCDSVPDNTEDVIDLQIHVSANVGSTVLEGDSNYFSIVVHTDIQPTKLIVDNDFQTIYVDEGQSVSTPDLTNSIVTDY